MNKEAILKQYFGHDTFRPGQELLIDHLLQGRDVFGIMPTGGGKSMCYQIPAIMLPGITIVVSPLISLMADQVAALKQAGIPAAYLNRSLTQEQFLLVYRRLRAGAYKILYVSPERLNTPDFLDTMSQLPLSLLAVDEAHCISQWGQDFRPSYLEIPDFLKAMPKRPPIGVFTATATDEVRQDIIRLLGLKDPHMLVSGFDRPNLFFRTYRMHETDKPTQLRSLLFSRKGKSGIVYCSTRATVDRVCADLKLYGLKAVPYHAGMSEEERKHSQEAFQMDRVPIMVATNAFGMGIDKSNVSFVIHYNMPKSMEAYYQEAGRAGRDGSPSECFLLFSQSDIRTARFLIENSGDNPALTAEELQQIRDQDNRRLEAMISYSNTGNCQRGMILDYFGQKHPPVCGYCGNCKAHYDMQDITRPAQMILSSVKRIQNCLGHSVNAAAIVRHLRSESDSSDAPQLSRLSTYGIMKDYTRDQIEEFLDHLITHDLLAPDQSKNALYLTPHSSGVLFHGVPVLFPVHVDDDRAPVRNLPGEISESSEDLYRALVRCRADIANRFSIPPYVIFSNATLMDMVSRRPTSFKSFLMVKGVARKKAEKYADEFISVIQEFI